MKGTRSGTYKHKVLIYYYDSFENFLRENLFPSFLFFFFFVNLISYYILFIYFFKYKGFNSQSYLPDIVKRNKRICSLLKEIKGNENVELIDRLDQLLRPLSIPITRQLLQGRFRFHRESFTKRCSRKFESSRRQFASLDRIDRLSTRESLVPRTTIYTKCYNAVIIDTRFFSSPR